MCPSQCWALRRHRIEAFGINNFGKREGAREDRSRGSSEEVSLPICLGVSLIYQFIFTAQASV